MLWRLLGRLKRKEFISSAHSWGKGVGGGVGNFISSAHIHPSQWEVNGVSLRKNGERRKKERRFDLKILGDAV